jgi:hypothetical protein
MKPDECTLFSGGAAGTEAAFGACAERFGVAEVNFTFEGHRTARARGVRVLTDDELKKGDVSLEYVARLMNRRYLGESMPRVLQSLWHQVTSGEEIYVVGTILDDLTVRGGTGWGAELAKLLNKPLHVFDQPSDAWFTWDQKAWVRRSPDDAPVVGTRLFTGTGTQFLEGNGLRAIEGLFERSFGAAGRTTAPGTRT